MADQDKPTPVGLNLAKLERESAPPPLVITLDEKKRIEMVDAQEIDWQTLMMSVDSPHAFFRLVVKEKDQEAFFGTPLPVWKMRALMAHYSDHFGLGELGDGIASRR